MPPIYHKLKSVSEDSEVSPVCPSDKSTIELKLSTQYRWNAADKENRSTVRKTCPIAALCTTDLTWTDLGSKSVRRRLKKPTNQPTNQLTNQRAN